MKAPQKLGLDVVVDRNTGELVTLEINGISSGYDGLTDLDYEPNWDCLEIIGRQYKGQRILVNPQTAFDFYIENSANVKILKNEYDIELVFTPIPEEEITAKDLENFCGPLDDFAALIGFGWCLNDRRYQNIMINSPEVELLTYNKLLQYELLKDVDYLNMPKTTFVDYEINRNLFRKLQKKHGKIIAKPICGDQGQGVEVFGKDSKINWDKPPAKIGTPKKMEAFYRRMRKKNKEKAEDWLRERMDEKGVILQKFVETQPVISANNGKPYHARARLIWFGWHIGGYWALSEDPIGHKNENPIVNYCNTEHAQEFTVEEERLFRDYAHCVIPEILERAAEFRGRVDEYDRITLEHYKKALFGNPGTF